MRHPVPKMRTANGRPCIAIYVNLLSLVYAAYAAYATYAAYAAYAAYMLTLLQVTEQILKTNER